MIEDILYRCHGGHLRQTAFPQVRRNGQGAGATWWCPQTFCGDNLGVTSLLSYQAPVCKTASPKTYGLGLRGKIFPFPEFCESGGPYDRELQQRSLLSSSEDCYIVFLKSLIPILVLFTNFFLFWVLYIFIFCIYIYLIVFCLLIGFCHLELLPQFYFVMCLCTRLCLSVCPSNLLRRLLSGTVWSSRSPEGI